MEAVQKFGMSGMSTASSYGPCKGEEVVPDQFPVGLRVLVVDDDMTCLKILEQMLRKCHYHVTICSRATSALSLLRERKNCFDLVLSDVHMPDMDGFKLLELVGLEMDLPVIMMSADGRTCTVMKGIKHGACDYLIKPVLLEQLKNIWQHVIRKKWNENKEHEQSGSFEDSDRHKRGADDGEYASSVNDGTDCNWKAQKKKRDAKEDEDDGELENDDPSASKKPRVVWSVELHQQFVSAVNQLGIDKAVPKRILELMNVPGLTRENVASHLQKFRLYLKRLSGVAQHQGGLANSFCGPVETNAKVNPLSRIDFQSLAASGQIPPQTLAALHAELLGRPSGGVVMPALDQPVLLQSSIPGPKCIPVERGVAFGQPLMKCTSNIPQQFPQSNITIEDMSSGFGTWSSNSLTTVSTSNIGGLGSSQSGNILGQMLQQQQQQPPPPPQQPVLSESSHAINVQPSCLVAPSQTSNSFQVGNNPVSLNQSSLFVPSRLSNGFQAGIDPAPVNQQPSYINCNTVMDHTLISPLSNNVSMGVRQVISISPPSNNVSVGIGQVVDGNFKNTSGPNVYPIPGSISSSMSPCSVGTDGSTGWRMPNSALNASHASMLPGVVPNLCDVQSSGTKSGIFPDQGQGRNLGFVGKGICIPSRFAVDDMESPIDDMSQKQSSFGDNGGRVKQEMHLDFVEGSKVGNSALAHFPPSDFMSVLSK